MCMIVYVYREREVDRLDTSELDLAKSRMIERHERSWVYFFLHFFLCVCAEDPSMPQPNADYPAVFNCNIRQPWEKVSIHWSMNGKASGDPISWPVESIVLGKLMTYRPTEIRNTISLRHHLRDGSGRSLDCSVGHQIVLWTNLWVWSPKIQIW